MNSETAELVWEKLVKENKILTKLRKELCMNIFLGIKYLLFIAFLRKPHMDVYQILVKAALSHAYIA